MSPHQIRAADQDARKVLTRYWGEVAARDVFFRGIRGGFSGSRVWELRTEANQYYFLKQWPIAGVSLERLTQIHLFQEQLTLGGVGNRAIPSIPIPLRNQLGQTITEFEGHFWELMPKLSGVPRTPSELTSGEAIEALQTTAALHLAMKLAGERLRAHFPQTGQVARSPGLHRRRETVSRLLGVTDRLKIAMQSAGLDPQIFRKCFQLWELATPNLVHLGKECGWDDVKLPLQPCIRDLWFAHLLFDQSKAVGVIDFGSMGEDCVTTDLARLLRSWFPSGSTDFTPFLEAYAEVRPLQPVEKAAFVTFDRTSRVLSAFQWIEWLALEQREFDDWEMVSDRLDFVLARLPDPA